MKILLVDDDPLILRIYGDGLRSRGFEVESAEDGLDAARILREAKPDAIVLDLMMPKLSGLEVIKYVRSRKDLDDVPVIVFSNAYMTELAAQAAAAGADTGLFKVACTPAVLADTLERILSGEGAGAPKADLLVVPGAPAEGATNPTAAPPPEAPPARPPAPPGLGQLPPAQGPSRSQDPMQFRRDFLNTGLATLATLQSLLEAFREARSDVDRKVQGESLYRKVHFLTVAARAADCHYVAQMASVLEALLIELITFPGWVTPTILRTVAEAVGFFRTLFEQERKVPAGPAPTDEIKVLVMDDDDAPRNVIVSALRKAHFKADRVGDLTSALEWLAKQHYDAILLDLDMAGINGFDFCRRVQGLPRYRNTPVICVSSESEFESRAAGALRGGQVLIVKPIRPMDLAVNVVHQTMKSRLLGSLGPNRAAEK